MTRRYICKFNVLARRSFQRLPHPRQTIAHPFFIIPVDFEKVKTKKLQSFSTPEFFLF